MLIGVFFDGMHKICYNKQLPNISSRTTAYDFYILQAQARIKSM